MPYSQFTTLKKATDAFNLTVVETKFFPEIAPIAPSDRLADYLEDSLPIGKHPIFAKIFGDWKSRLHKQSLPPQAIKISPRRRTSFV